VRVVGSRGRGRRPGDGRTMRVDRSAAGAHDGAADHRRNGRRGRPEHPSDPRPGEAPGVAGVARHRLRRPAGEGDHPQGAGPGGPENRL